MPGNNRKPKIPQTEMESRLIDFVSLTWCFPVIHNRYWSGFLHGKPKNSIKQFFSLFFKNKEEFAGSFKPL